MSDLKFLIEKVKQGDTEAFEQFYAETYKTAYFHVKRVIADEDEALDALQETYIQVYKSINKLENTVAVKAWIGSIATHMALNKIRKKRPVLFKDEATEMIEQVVDEDFETQPEKVVERDGKAKDIMEIIEKLPEVQKITLILYYYDEKTVLEIAQIMECSEGTVKSRLNYARKFIKVEVENQAKKGNKLYSVSAPLIVFAVSQMYETCEAYASSMILGNVMEALNLATTVTSQTAGVGATKATMSVISAKSITIAVASVVAVGVIGVSINNNKAKEVVPTSISQNSTNLADNIAVSTNKEVENEFGITKEMAKSYYDKLLEIQKEAGEDSIKEVGFMDMEGTGENSLYVVYYSHKDWEQIGVNEFNSGYNYIIETYLYKDGSLLDGLYRTNITRKKDEGNDDELIRFSDVNGKKYIIDEEFSIHDGKYDEKVAGVGEILNGEGHRVLIIGAYADEEMVARANERGKNDGVEYPRVTTIAEYDKMISQFVGEDYVLIENGIVVHEDTEKVSEIIGKLKEISGE